MAVKRLVYITLTCFTLLAPSRPASAQTLDAAKKELLLWNSIKDSNKTTDYLGYLDSFPNGTFAQVARRRVEELFWNSIKNSNKVVDYQDYLGRYPNGVFAPNATERILSLTPTAEQIARTAQEEESRQFPTRFIMKNGILDVSRAGLKWTDDSNRTRDFRCACGTFQIEKHGEGALSDLKIYSQGIKWTNILGEMVKDEISIRSTSPEQSVTPPEIPDRKVVFVLSNDILTSVTHYCGGYR